MFSKEYQTLLQRLNTPRQSLSLQETRQYFEDLMEQYPPPFDVDFQDVTLCDLPCEWVIPKKSSGKTLILFFHGGGFILGSAYSHRGMVALMAQGIEARALSVNYRLSPEFPFPTSIEDCARVYFWLIREAGYLPSQIIFAGSSAGANLVVSTMLFLKQKGIPLPKAGVCLSPWVDLTLSGKSLITNAGKDIITKDGIEMAASYYLNGHDPKDPLASPIFADLSRLPKLLIHAGDREVLLDDAKSLAKKAQEDGVKVTLEIWKEMIHACHLFAPKIPEGKALLDAVVLWIREN